MENQTDLADFGIGFNWHKYNLSQTKEKAIFANILGELIALIEEEEHNKVGRKPTKIKDLVFATTFKQYANTSSRRLQSDLRLFKDAGFMSTEIPFNTLLDNMERPELKEVLRGLIEISSLPLKQIEVDFAIDATCFGTSRYETYFDVRYGKKKDSKGRVWKKCHAVCGVKTNIITSVDISEGYVHDFKYLEPLAKDTARNFKIRNFCADKGYLSGEIFSIIKELGGQAFVPFKSNTTGNSNSQSQYRSYFKQAYRFFKEHKEQYMNNYHKRSNIESTFSMIKRRFGNNLKCKKELSQENEILARILAHNICVLVQELFISKVDLNFHFHLKNYVARE